MHLVNKGIKIGDYLKGKKVEKVFVEQIYKMYFEDVYYFLLSLSKDVYVAEDLSSEVFLIFIQHLENLKDVDAIKSWLLRVAKNEFLQYIRKNKKVQYLEEIFDGVVTRPASCDIDAQVMAKRKLEFARKWLSSLAEKKQMLYLMRVMLGLSYEEIGQYFDKSANWACVSFFRLKQELLSGLQAKEGEDYEQDK